MSICRERPFKCTLCAESFVTRTVLNFHMRYHGEAQKLFRCEFCFKELTSEYSLKGHINRLHKPTSQCELCKLEFSSRDVLKDHMITAHGPSVCKTCGKSFVLPRYLKVLTAFYIMYNNSNHIFIVMLIATIFRCTKSCTTLKRKSSHASSAQSCSHSRS